MRVLVCDDLPVEIREFEGAIQEANLPNVSITRLFGDKLKKQLNTLFKGADAVLGDDTGTYDPPQTEFQDADIVILDNNLAHLRIEGARLTAEAIAGYIRAFSSAPYIVSVNKNPDVDFDLRYLIGDYTTRTDLAVNIAHLSNLALWTHQCADAKNSFLPWYWPKLLDIGENRRKKIEFIESRLDEMVCDVFDITSELFGFLSRQARSLLSLAEETSEDGSGEATNLGLYSTFRGCFWRRRVLFQIRMREKLSSKSWIRISRALGRSSPGLWQRRSTSGFGVTY